MMQRQPDHVLIDRARIDCFVSSESAGTKILIKRPWLTVAIDVYGSESFSPTRVRRSPAASLPAHTVRSYAMASRTKRLRLWQGADRPCQRNQKPLQN